MPFDCAPSIDAPDPSTVGKGDLRNLVGASPIGAVRTRPIPWHISRRLGLTLGRAALVPRILRSRLVRCPGTAPIGVGPALLRFGRHHAGWPRTGSADRGSVQSAEMADRDLGRALE
jgi:hypothetical protein